jgi:hypothetical protein
MNSFEALLSDTRNGRNLMGRDLINKEDEMLGGTNCDPKTE